MNKGIMFAAMLLILFGNGGCGKSTVIKSESTSGLAIDTKPVSSQPPASTSPTSALKHSILVKPDGTRFNLDQLPNELDAMADRINENIKTGKGADNFILYVHGRGQEPDKCLAKKHTCLKLQQENTAEVIMFNWQGSHDGGPAGYPNKQAEASGSDLKAVLDIYRQYKDTHKDKFGKIRSALIVHSMGSNVLRKALDRYDDNSLGQNLFDTIILSANAVEAKGHIEWLGKIKFSDHIYVTGNEHDPILGPLARLHFDKRLGQGLKAWEKSSVELSGQANYLDFSNINGLGHQYFVKSGQKGNPYLARFFATVLDGKPFEPKDFPGIKEQEQGNGNVVYIFKAK